uniref:Zgc:66448 n=1 Tax=Scophthalmus maximus TaxID=52904 RepID=A0A8D3CTU8_SCOMX
MNKQGEKGHTCPHCPYVCLDESSLNIHLSSVHKPVAQNLEKVAAPPIKQLIPLSSDNVQGKWRSDVISMKSYKCSECGKTFRHRSVLELHMRIHSKDKPYQCKVCSKGFRFSSYLQQHLIIHTGQKPYKCPDCGKDFAFLQNMKTHQKLHQEKPFRCTSCRKGYSDETQLQQHMLSHTGDKPHKPHRCEECHKTFSWFSSLLVHQKIHARKRPGFSQYNSFPMGARMRGRGSRGRRGGRLTWGWSRPLEGSASKSLLHDLEHLKKKAFQCESCGRNYSRASALDAHRRCHEEKLVKSRNRNSGESLHHEESIVEAKPQKSQAEDAPEKLFKCTCGKAFAALYRLKAHQRFMKEKTKQNQESEFNCSECKKSFNGHIALFNHQRWHKAFECKDCGLKFSRASALHSHQLHHTDVFGETEKEAQMRSSL